MDGEGEDRTRPSINFTHLADRLLLANGSMVAFRHKLELQNGTSKPNGTTLQRPSSRSSQFSDEGYATIGSHEPEHEVDFRNGPCATGSQGTGNRLNGFAKNGHSMYAPNDNIGNPPSPTEEGIRDHCCKVSRHQAEYQMYTESKRSENSPAPKPERQKARASRPPLLPPCRVCGDRASGFHYGVNTCEACKGFFRRSINKSSEAYACVGSGRCKLVPGKRTACSSCRYQRCVEVGMSKSAIKTGRYTHELRSKNIMEVKKLQMQNSSDMPSEPSPERTDVVIKTEDTVNASMIPCNPENRDMEELLQILVEGQKNLHEFLDDYYNEDLMRSRQLAVYERYMRSKREPAIQNPAGTPEPAERNRDQSVKLKTAMNPVQRTNETGAGNTTANTVRETKCDRVNRKYTSSDSCGNVRNPGNPGTNEWSAQSLKYGNFFSRENSGTGTLTNAKSEQCTESGESNDHHSGSDKKGVGEEGRPDNAGEKKKAEVLSQALQDMERGVQGMLSYSKCLPGFGDLPKEDQGTLLKAARFDIWYIGHIRCFNTDLRVGACEWQFHAEELEKVWGKPIVDIAFRLSRRGQELNLTKEETAALRAVCLSFPDRCYPLTERDTVEAMHGQMFELFRYVSSKRHRHFNSWFSKVVDFLTILREFGVSFERTSNSLKLDWSVLHDNPYLLDVFLS